MLTLEVGVLKICFPCIFFGGEQTIAIYCHSYGIDGDLTLKFHISSADFLLFYFRGAVSLLKHVDLRCRQQLDNAAEAVSHGQAIVV